jgi:hypothetical protein
MAWSLADNLVKPVRCSGTVGQVIADETGDVDGRCRLGRIGQARRAPLRSSRPRTRARLRLAVGLRPPEAGADGSVARALAQQRGRHLLAATLSHAVRAVDSVDVVEAGVTVCA